MKNNRCLYRELALAKGLGGCSTTLRCSIPQGLDNTWAKLILSQWLGLSLAHHVASMMLPLCPLVLKRIEGAYGPERGPSMQGAEFA